MARLFIAVWPSDDVVERLRELPRKDGPGVRWVPPDNWHTTLRFLGEADPDDVASRLDGADLPPATARYGPGIDVMFDKVVVVPVHGLDRLAEVIAGVTRDAGSQPPARRFRGHLTVARLERRGWIPPVIGAPLAATHDVAEIVLVASTLQPEGAVYEMVATWPTG